ERWQVEHQQIQGTATATGVAPGNTFALYNAPFFSDNGEYLTTEANYFFEENRYASGSDGETVHRIDFTVIPSSVVFRPAAVTAWPKTYGPQTAKVVGPQGESIWTDKYGRVKVKFHWDRLAKGDDTSSCWVRVSSAWAGQGFGGVQIPRVGDEVVIDFINGDPDRPIVTGRVYNESSMPPWSLPDDSTRMGFMTRSKDGSKDNASYLFFEDRAGSEAVELHSEKDMKVSVENDKTVNIDGNRTTTILKEQKDDVTGDASFHYRAKRTTTVDEAETTTFNNSQTETIKNGRKLDITSGGDAVTVTGGRTSNIDGTELHHVTGKLTEKYDSGQETTIAAGGRKETIDGGVTIDVNSGNWTQNVNAGTIAIFSPDVITIKSDSKVSIDVPFMESRASSHKESFVGNNFSMTGASESITGASASRTGVSLSHSNVSVSHNTFGYSNKAMEIKQIKAVVKSGGLSMSSKLLTLFL
ncbi:type VI secretion system tip protein TssI/VgrG, partial [Kosakonia sacchari]|uniref:type VI secretion system Vgr family protein n=3 Tax=Enterobacteriaceae TaxID=543 RepID=UPI0028AE2AE0